MLSLSSAEFTSHKYQKYRGLEIGLLHVIYSHYNRGRTRHAFVTTTDSILSLA